MRARAPARVACASKRMGRQASPPTRMVTITRAPGRMVLSVTKPAPSDSLGVTCESNGGGTRIKELEAGCLLAAAGARVGDVVVSVGGVSVTGANMAARMLTAAEGSFEVVVERANPEANPRIEDAARL